MITMSMEINNYSSYATNYTERIKKSDSKAATEVKTGTSANSKDGVQEYYEKLCKKFPEITFNTGSSLMSGNENKEIGRASCRERV